MKHYLVTVRAPAVEKPLTLKISVYSHTPWDAVIKAHEYAVEAEICSPSIDEIEEIVEEEEDACTRFEKITPIIRRSHS